MAPQLYTGKLGKEGDREWRGISKRICRIAIRAGVGVMGPLAR
jgi:hypothetical protein